MNRFLIKLLKLLRNALKQFRKYLADVIWNILDFRQFLCYFEAIDDRIMFLEQNFMIFLFPVPLSTLLLAI